MPHETRGYVAYLLRLWQARCETGVAWRASLESARTGERVGFASLEAFFTFLEKEVCQVTAGQATTSTGGNGGDIDE
jgi:hypothetical protein